MHMKGVAVLFLFCFVFFCYQQTSELGMIITNGI